MKPAVCVLLKSKPTPIRYVAGAVPNSSILTALLLLAAVYWSINAVATSTAVAQDTSSRSTISVIESALNSDDASARVLQSRAHQLSIGGTFGESATVPLTSHRMSDASLLDANQIASRQVTHTWETSVDKSSGEYESRTPNTANSRDSVCPKDSGDSRGVRYAESPKPSLLPVCDLIRLIPYSRATFDRSLNDDGLFVSDESWLADRTPIVSKQTAPPIPLLVIHLGSYDLPVVMRDGGW